MSLLHEVPSRAADITITVITNPPQGGTITGAGVYPVGTSPPIQIQAANGWYISNVDMEPQGALGFVTERVSVGLSGGDLTTITNDTEAGGLTSSSTVTITFTPLSPIFNEQPAGQVLLSDTAVTLQGGANGRRPVTYQWQVNSNNIPGATNSQLTLTNAMPRDSGVYTLVASNAFGTNVSLPAVVEVDNMFIFGNGTLISNSVFNAGGSAQIAIQSRFNNPNIFYTLDGSPPDFNGNEYFGPFTVTQSATLRVIAYSDDFFEADLSDPVALSILPNYALSATTAGGGYIETDPYAWPYGIYPSNTAVTVTAVPYTGFVFMGWSGALSGTNPVAMLAMDQDLSVQAVFGTTLATTAANGGSVSVFPQASLYPYGSLVRVTAVPDAGNYFGIWGNAATGKTNPLLFSVVTGTPEVSALFAPLSGGQAALTVLSTGGGAVTIAPQTNRFPTGSTAVLTAIPVAGQRFLGWSGDVGGTNNPVSLKMTGSKVVTAQFSHVPAFAMSLQSNNQVQLLLNSIQGDVCRIDVSSNLTTWTPLVTITNFFGTFRFTDPAGYSLPLRMYRAVAQ